MNDFNSFVKTARELQVTHENQVVKVAGILDRLKKLWQSITNPQYRSSVSHLGDEFDKAQDHLQEMQGLFDDLSKSLESGDISQYSQTLDQIKVLIGQFLDKVREADKKTKEVYKWTVKEMREPGFIDRVNESLPQKFDIEYGKKYNTPLSEFSRFNNIEPNIHMSPGAQHHLALNVLRKLETVIQFENNEEREALKKLLFNNRNFTSAFERAALQGTLIEAAPMRPGKDQKATAGQSEFLVLTQPFQIPGAGHTIQVKVWLKDNRISLDKKKRLALRETIDVDVLNLKTAQAQSQLFPYRRSKLNQLELAKALRDGFKLAFGRDPSLEELAGGFSQAILESGWPIYLPNNNIGNIKATSDWISSGKPYFIKGTIEFTPDGKKIKEHGTKWRAYSTPAEGAAGYWKLIGDRYKKALDWYAAGDPKSAAVALAMKGYYTAPVTKYAAGLGMHHKRFMEQIAPKLPGLKSEAAPPPGTTPALKKWVAEYTPEEKKEILKEIETPDKPSMVAQIEPLAAPQSEPPNQFNELMSKLVSSDGSLTKMVKRSIMQDVLPENNVLILVKSSDSYEAQLEYARVCASYLRKVLGGSAEVCSNGKKVEIQCTSAGNLETLSQAVGQLSYLVAVGMKKKTSYTMKPIIAAGLLSIHDYVDPQTLTSNSRKFHLIRLKNG